MPMKKPSVTRGPADAYAMRGERIVEVSDNNGKGLGALLSVAYDDTPPALFLRVYRVDEGVTVTVDSDRERQMAELAAKLRPQLARYDLASDDSMLARVVKLVDLIEGKA